MSRIGNTGSVLGLVVLHAVIWGVLVGLTVVLW